MHNKPSATPSQPAPATASAETPAITESAKLNDLVNPQPSPGLPVVHNAAQQLPAPNAPAADAVPAVIDTQAVAVQRRHSRRNGRIASLPKIHRDLVGRMVWNSVPYKNIVLALEDCGVGVTERNISNWVTRGGYLEWRAEQELVLQNRLDQDHLVDHLRRDDASELPEVGLQAAATRLSQILLQKTHRAEDLEANLGHFSQMVDILCRLNREIGTLQKQRDDSRRSLDRAHDPVRIKHFDETTIDEYERFYSNPPSDSTLPRPPAPPALPPESTAALLANMDKEEAHERKLADMEQMNAWLRAMTTGKGNNGSATPKPPPTPPRPSPGGNPR